MWTVSRFVHIVLSDYIQSMLEKYIMGYSQYQQSPTNDNISNVFRTIPWEKKVMMEDELPHGCSGRIMEDEVPRAKIPVYFS